MNMLTTISPNDLNIDDFRPWPEPVAHYYRQQGFWKGDDLGRILRESSQLFADKVAIVDGSEQVSYRKLLQRVDRLSAGFLQQGLKGGDRVVVHLPNGIRFFEVFFALIKIAVRPILALANHRYSEISYFCQHSQAKAYICQIKPDDTVFEKIAGDLIKDRLVQYVFSDSHNDAFISLELLASLTCDAIAFPSPFPQGLGLL